jgi:hypothetical protein
MATLTPLLARLATMVERHIDMPSSTTMATLGMLSIRNVLQARIDTLTRQLDEARSTRVSR